MPEYRDQLPPLSTATFIDDGGLETTLIFKNGIDLREFAAFDLLRHEAGYQSLLKYFQTYLDIAIANQIGFILESPTWRANPDWGQKLGYSAQELCDINRQAIALLQHLRNTHETEQTPMVISGCIGHVEMDICPIRR